jgi:hypothetical protein
LAVVESTTEVTLGVRRGGPDVATVRADRWWIEPVVTVAVLTAFIVYSTWAAFQNQHYYAGADLNRDLLSPFYSPCIASNCLPGAANSGFMITVPSWLSPALLILIFPLGFRLTCYYYRKAYYRAFWWSPPACAVADAHPTYSGETRFPLVMQNVHRYFFWFGIALNVVLTYDAIRAFRQPNIGIGVTVGTIVLSLNAILLWCYSLSCHFCRHICGGQVRSFKQSPLRHRLWRLATPLNARHMQIAWASLIMVALADVYVRLVATGAITDYRLF